MYVNKVAIDRPQTADTADMDDEVDSTGEETGGVRALAATAS